jgi:hypothetical protein
MATQSLRLFAVRTLATATLVAIALLGAAGDSFAVGSCKAKVDKKTGVVRMSATNVVGAYAWRDSASEDLLSFYGPGCTVAGDSIVGCPLADPATTLGKVPPPSCEVCIEDDSANGCCARLKNCTPGTRDCQVVSAQIPVAASSAQSLTVDCPDGYKATGGGGQFGVFFGFYPLQRSLSSTNGKSWTCQAHNAEPLEGTLTCRATCCRMP